LLPADPPARPRPAPLGPLLGRAQPCLPGAPVPGRRSPGGGASRPSDSGRSRGPLRRRGRLVALLGRRLARSASLSTGARRHRVTQRPGRNRAGQGAGAEGEAAPAPAAPREVADAPATL